MKAFIAIVHKLSDVTGLIAAVLFLPLIFIVFFEVVSRYVFNKPTIWGWDILIQLATVIAVLAAGHALAKREHVMVDVIVQHFSPKTRACIDLVTGLVFFLSMGVLVWFSTDYAIWSISHQEGWSSVWRPPFYQIRIIIVIGIAVLTLEGVAKFLEDLEIIRKPPLKQDANIPESSGEVVE